MIRKFEVRRRDEGVARDNVHVFSLPAGCKLSVQHDTQLVYLHQRLPPKRGAAASILRQIRSLKVRLERKAVNRVELAAAADATNMPFNAGIPISGVSLRDSCLSSPDLGSAKVSASCHRH